MVVLDMASGKGGPPGAMDDQITLLDGQRAAASLLEVNSGPVSEGAMEEGASSELSALLLRLPPSATVTDTVGDWGQSSTYSRCVQPIASAAALVVESDYIRSLVRFLAVCVVAASYSRFLAAYCGVPQKINRSWQHWMFTLVVAFCGATAIHRICRPSRLWVTAATPFVYSLIQMVVGAIPLTADTDYMKSAPALGLATIVVAASSLGILMTRYAYYHVDCVGRLMMGIVFLIFLWLRTPPGYSFHLHHYLHCTLLALAFGRVKGDEAVPAIAQAILIGMALQGAAVWGTDSLYDEKVKA
ncbi:hypothetical protein Pmar_PMAR025500 [Perkinsus marinus ATCC 50983]|uniref:Uncharacterized protein n=1 Tax=Perkinsus marinus (strain ATCC 50983 / TXsc) TaxID=423536 RepID=C5LZ84_PERM5|nr:hypothetical protein Pmar_PMAR025500 [Perkinsus marinus ATCC 50983]EEQ97879.1 hypothetical protein Pmar_PMAR025500 [Perkinsus marinus ATCC 50983]|eukprot:XP_002765162.1 hypothetical protein Pmar_PMAR025500 [Perkinsus marinus ATCC 50983]